MFFIAFLIIAIACSVISIRTLIGYSDFNFIYKLLISFVIVLGWFGSFIINSNNELLIVG